MPERAYRTPNGVRDQHKLETEAQRQRLVNRIHEAIDDWPVGAAGRVVSVEVDERDHVAHEAEVLRSRGWVVAVAADLGDLTIQFPTLEDRGA